MTRKSRMPASDVQLYAKLHRLLQYPIAEAERYRSQDEAGLTDPCRQGSGDSGRLRAIQPADGSRSRLSNRSVFHYANRAAPGKLIALDYCRSMLDEAKSAVNAGRADI